MDYFISFLVPPLPLADVFFAFRTSNFAGKVIVVLLFVGSIFAWTIMITKYMELRRARAESKRFLQAFRKEGHPVALFLRRQRFPDSPLYKIYEMGCSALGAELEARGVDTQELFMGSVGTPPRHLNATQIDGVRNVTERTVADLALLLEDKMGLLATAVSASPFLGLLGTVWGVMDAFGGMAVTGAATLSAVAPGIAGALLTTVIGLLVALPSAIGYNLLTNRIRELCVDMDNFAQEFTAEIRRAFHVE
ncbi:MAG: MotA/TolQ/ExbB proton channel family protein [Kiritimatiellae bacterium]|nr:MotA/TolQ/ExbB proton channel family protein [Kiritimatiellia bacterium]